MAKAATVFYFSFSAALLFQLQVTAMADTESANSSVCAPVIGQGAQSLQSCEKAAELGDGGAAMIVGSIYWNGDGVPKDNTQAAIWWKVADRHGAPEAPFALGGEAYVRAMQSKGKGDIDIVALDEALHWYEKAVRVDLVLEKRQQAQALIDQIIKAKSLMRRG